MIPTSHKICIFSLSFIFFWTSDAVVFFSSSALMLSKSPTSCSSNNFPLHLHNCFLMYTDDKILPNKYVLKWYLILVTHSSNFFCSLYIMDDNWIGNLWQPMPFVGEKNAYMPEIYYITVLLFLHQMEAIIFNILQIFFNMWEKLLWIAYCLRCGRFRSLQCSNLSQIVSS